MTLEPPKFHGSQNIFNEISAVGFYGMYFLLRKKFFLVNLQMLSQLKLVLRSGKNVNKIWLRKIFGDQRKYWWFGCHE